MKGAVYGGIGDKSGVARLRRDSERARRRLARALYFIPAPPKTITIAAGVKGGAFEHFANRYKERLARHHVTLNMCFATAGELARLITDPNGRLGGLSVRRSNHQRAGARYCVARSH